MRSLVCIEAAHNPATAGPRVQIPPPQPKIFDSERSAVQPLFPTAIFVRKEALAVADHASKIHAPQPGEKKIQRSSVVERSAVNAKTAFFAS